MYQAQQGDLIWLDFDPSKGKEIQKRRPGLVISGNSYNRVTGFAIIVPITSQTRSWSSRYDLIDYDIKGQINTNQLYSFDLSQRNPEFIQKLDDSDFFQIAQMINQNFDFGL
ncbi:type II toxin-antitoxin system PemK/MazF family toxin [Convivina praedatoris]|uniref:Uncharacterized protein n=1 Tax=Convivina praedatoris TaxID=2880963 RepID=A0ABM9D1H5_9LACO|nr:type II toxin-antitoxin system PemK/MazF family toxin [Convivina sp. LMG 32447]CAH1851750.1 hypothetical protein R077815_00392 [Convivina sp. LMG 32447]CAH1853827.1 hypothetical protein LMG032447_00724 [Convivina sp. LMG 32447]CAH1854251.1 hypothetical protein R078138_00838 [Convivina sp. LMG 32447]